MMKLLSALIACVTIVTVLASSEMQLNDRAQADATMVVANPNCEPGRNYCLGQIVYDLGVDLQTILHQYCKDQFTIDAQSCHACSRFPQPLPNCGAGPGAWNSVFECKGGQKYEFKFRCDEWCEAAQCIKKPTTWKTL